MLGISLFLGGFFPLGSRGPSRPFCTGQERALLQPPRCCTSMGRGHQTRSFCFWSLNNGKLGQMSCAGPLAFILRWKGLWDSFRKLCLSPGDEKGWAFAICERGMWQNVQKSYRPASCWQSHAPVALSCCTALSG